MNSLRILILLVSLCIFLVYIITSKSHERFTCQTKSYSNMSNLQCDPNTFLSSIKDNGNAVTISCCPIDGDQNVLSKQAPPPPPPATTQEYTNIVVLNYDVTTREPNNDLNDLRRDMYQNQDRVMYNNNKNNQNSYQYTQRRDF